MPRTWRSRPREREGVRCGAPPLFKGGSAPFFFRGRRIPRFGDDGLVVDDARSAAGAIGSGRVWGSAKERKRSRPKREIGFQAAPWSGIGFSLGDHVDRHPVGQHGSFWEFFFCLSECERAARFKTVGQIELL